MQKNIIHSSIIWMSAFTTFVVGWGAFGQHLYSLLGENMHSIGFCCLYDAKGTTPLTVHPTDIKSSSFSNMSLTCR